MDWSGFYAHQTGRAVRPTFSAALEAAAEAADGARFGASGDEKRTAVDLGCGDGLESRTLLADGWRVLAIDADPNVVQRVTADVPEGEQERLTVRQASFADVAETPLPDADLVYAGFALPFCTPEVFEKLWSNIRSALQPGGVFAGQLFGPHDDFAAWEETNTHGRADVDRLLDGLEVLQLHEEDRDGTSFAGPKHWHVFHIVARRPR
ncbi:class I SAM-dependent methyltransferase [Humibacter albus]|uniref:class I SAM-dependent methyltransferase n=1 Tax=Humibacter albus TaxID=427754 RepID=UPI0003B3A1D7|nr:class I SAM-dependent methyltransferase [Humibacter albus]